MKQVAKYIKKTRLFLEGYHNLCAAVFIFIAAFLLFSTQVCGNLLRMRQFFQISVQPIDLATSPAVRNLAEGLDQKKNTENSVAGDSAQD